jgi:hypothetical protein
LWVLLDSNVFNDLFNEEARNSMLNERLIAF